MTSLSHIQNWPERAQQVKWSASALAKQCGVSERTLRRHFQKKMGKGPKNWLAEQRQRNARELLRDGSSIKEIATCLGYKQQTNFARQFKNQMGFCPSESASRASNFSNVRK
jgi:AraC family transcriptional regulator of arabinose operon